APADWWLGLPDLTGKVVRVDIDPAAIVTNVVPAVSLVGDAARTVRALRERLGGAAADGPQQAERDGTGRAARWRERHREAARAEGGPWLEIVDAIAEALPRDAIVAGGRAVAGYHRAPPDLPPPPPPAVPPPAGAGPRRVGLPAGLAAKSAPPAAAAAELGIALPVVVVDNGGYGEIRNEMADRDEPVHAVALGRPDFPALARSMGCHGVGAADPAALTREIKAALEADRPTLIHVREDSRAARGMT